MRVLGVPQLLGRFAKTAIAGQAATKVGQAEVAQEVETSAKQRVPVLTGTLQDSIHAETDRVPEQREPDRAVVLGCVDRQGRLMSLTAKPK